jgi:hypothetical protein
VTRPRLRAAGGGVGCAAKQWHVIAMANQTYRGSCHCGAIRFEADLDLSQGTGKCNCSYCWKVRNWSIGIKPDAFRLLAGQDHEGEYGFRENSDNHHVFCKRCGVRVYTRGYVEQIGGHYVSVMLSTLDDLPPATLAAAPVRYMNGRDDDWFHPPAETAHL